MSSGSPPRVWGKPAVRWSACLFVRFTPTRVGKTCLTLYPSSSAAVHPHACGENQTWAADYSVQTGSPPRVWGKLSSPTFFLFSCWFTPTRVGKTAWRAFVSLSVPVHPHACGENGGSSIVNPHRCGSPPRVWGKRLHWMTTLRPSGSPPRVWGKRVDPTRLLYPVRFTPTRVGKTQRRAHRVCLLPGSPPRVWGKPATASSLAFCKAVHPHACGENLVWELVQEPGVRFTPTRVGKTAEGDP